MNSKRLTYLPWLLYNCEAIYVHNKYTSILFQFKPLLYPFIPFTPLPPPRVIQIPESRFWLRTKGTITRIESEADETRRIQIRALFKGKWGKWEKWGDKLKERKMREGED
jgi:hypothetical protein